MKQLNECQHSSQNNDSKLDKPISDAEIEIKDLTRKLTRLKRAVQIFKDNKRDGIPWPGENQPGEKVG